MISASEATRRSCSRREPASRRASACADLESQPLKGSLLTVARGGHPAGDGRHSACGRNGSTLIGVQAYNRAVDEHKLAGGRTNVVVRVGDTVHRRASAATTAVHALLRHLEAIDFKGVPRVHGFDDDGREVLSFVEGETVGGQWPWPSWVFTDETIIQVGRWMRAYHDATRTFVPPKDAVWLVGQPWRPGMVIAHNDAAPYNAVWRNGALVGFVDFDIACPSEVELDLAYTALTWVPLHSGQSLGAKGPAGHDERRHRLGLLLDAYRYDGDRISFGATIAHRARLNAAVIRQQAAQGNPASVALLPTAADLEKAAAEIEGLPSSFWDS